MITNSDKATNISLLNVNYEYKLQIINCSCNWDGTIPFNLIYTASLSIKMVSSHFSDPQQATIAIHEFRMGCGIYVSMTGFWFLLKSWVFILTLQVCGPPWDVSSHCQNSADLIWDVPGVGGWRDIPARCSWYRYLPILTTRHNLTTSVGSRSFPSVWAQGTTGRVPPETANPLCWHHHGCELQPRTKGEKQVLI